MEIIVTNSAVSEINTEVLVVTVFDDLQLSFLKMLNQSVADKIVQLTESGEIRGKYKEHTILHTDNCSYKRVLLMGMGQRKDFSIERLMAIGAIAARNVRRINLTEMAFVCNFNTNEQECIRAVAEGALLGLYKFNKYISKANNNYLTIKKMTLLVQEPYSSELNKAANEGITVSTSANFARDLVNEPASYMTPSKFAQLAIEVGNEHSIKTKVLDLDEIKQEDMGAIIAVNSGSIEPAKVIVMEYKSPSNNCKHLGLVGKGITFDSGGLSIKSSEYMYRMHCDMAGAAAVLGAMQAIAFNKLNVNVTAVIPVTENLVDAKSYKVGDIIKTREGKTVEILSTDAEGRLILADALSYIRSFTKLDYLVDIATLTGSVVYALGHFCSGVMTNCDELLSKLKKSGDVSGEKIWQLPLYEEYKNQIKSDIADLENSGGKPAGSICAGLFLQEFVGDICWAHLDIAGTAWMDESIMPYMRTPFLPKEGATGTGTRLLYYLAREISQKEPV